MEAIYCAIIILLMFQLCAFTNCQTEPVVNLQDATVKLDEDAVINCDYTLSGTRTLQGTLWYNSTSTGDRLNILIIPEVSNPNGRYTVDTSQTGVATLTIANTVLSDEGYYICNILDSVNENTDGFGFLNVYYLEKPVLNPTNLSVNATETVTFTCSNLIGLPTPITITWVKDDVTLDVSDTQKYPSSDATLTINDVDETDEGDYQCRAENAAYSATDGKISNTATLSIALTTTSFISILSTEVPKRENDCNSTGLVVGMTFVGVLIGFIICLLVVFILSKIRKSHAQVPTSKNTNQSGQEYMTYTGETGNETNHTYQDLQKKDDNQAVYVNVKAKKDKT